MEIVDELSFEKASEVADRYEKEQGITAKTVIICADTIVAYDNEIMGKPKDSEDAVRMIMLSFMKDRQGGLDGA